MIKKLNDNVGVRKSRGRPRDEDSNESLLNTTYRLLAKNGFSKFSVDDVVKKTGIAKTTIYRRWPSKSSLALAAVQLKISPFLSFPKNGTKEERLIEQMGQLVKLFQGEEGKIISTLIGASQDNPELRNAIKDEFLEPRRKIAREFFYEWKEFENLSFREMESLIDVVYGALYFRLLLNHAPISMKELGPWILKLVRND